MLHGPQPSEHAQPTEYFFSPYVFIQFDNLTPGIVISVHCKIWAKNIRHDTHNPRIGGVQFEILMDWCTNTIILWTLSIYLQSAAEGFIDAVLESLAISSISGEDWSESRSLLPSLAISSISGEDWRISLPCCCPYSFQSLVSCVEGSPSVEKVPAGIEPRPKN